jgi:NADPH2:quinone reductase
MQIWHSLAAGGPETLQLREVPDPVAAPGEVIIDVAACGINFPDCLIIRDQYQYRPERPFAPGGEIAGTVSSVGLQVDSLQPGDRVMVRTGWGGLATRVAVAAARCTVMPPAMSFAEGASFLFTYSTAWHALLQRGQVCAGEAVLVLGAAGGTGAAAVEIAKAVGARVIAAVSSEEKAAFARSIGADETIVYPLTPLSAAASRTLAEAFDYAEPALRAVGWKGRYLVIGFTAGVPRIPLNLPLIKGCSIVGVFNGRLNSTEPEVAAANVAALKQWYVDGKVHPHVTRRFPFAAAPEAIALIEQRGATGKLVVEMTV